MALLGGHLVAFLSWDILTMVTLTRFFINRSAFIFVNIMALINMNRFTDLGIIVVTLFNPDVSTLHIVYCYTLVLIHNIHYCGADLFSNIYTIQILYSCTLRRGTGMTSNLWDVSAHFLLSHSTCCFCYLQSMLGAVLYLDSSTHFSTNFSENGVLSNQQMNFNYFFLLLFYSF